MHRTHPAHVVISGASSGIGQATAEAFAERGARLVLAARGEEALQHVAERCRAHGAEVLVVPTDVKQAEQVQALATSARSFLGRIDLWFGNVGVGAVGSFHEVPIEASTAVVQANLIGRMHDAHAAIPIFVEQGHGVFVNMISLGGFAATPYAAAYSASKFGQRGFSEALRAELIDHPKVHVCDVYPYFVDTPGLSHGANYVGRRVTGPPMMLDTRTVAQAVVRLLDRPRNTVVIGPAVQAMRVGHALAPNLFARAMSRFFQRYFAQAPRVGRSSGNVFGPPAIAGGIDGGFRRRPAVRAHAGRNTLVIGAAVAALATVAVLAAKRAR
ncbi:SDR family oxidoreductase [Xanthomonas campestris]|uniref:SDR family oxidoreductase n=1 Tax=Xanthomonas campestris TaxID=339 RepID=UPI000E1EEF53|nr:SDR family oxidoreductase [Xanthomonas campestris]